MAMNNLKNLAVPKNFQLVISGILFQCWQQF